jgi:hypothetical protein
LAEELDQGLAPTLDVLGHGVDFQPVARGEDDPLRQEARTVSVGLTETGKGIGQRRVVDGKPFAKGN